jgi:alcohol dehydrogenase class IV
MNSFKFRSPGSVLMESGAASRIGEILIETGASVRSVLVVSDAGVERAGLLEAALSCLQQAGLSVTVFTGVEADPSAGTVMAAAAVAGRVQADAILGIGGGSPMDVAKLVALLVGNSQTLDSMYGVDVARGPRLPLVLVPTTAGTGSETTPVAIVTTGDGQKKGVVSGLLIPDCAVLDARLTLGLPRPGTAATGIDAMVHAIEAYTSKRLKNPVSDDLAREALGLLIGNIERVCEKGDDLAGREAMLLGASLAGLAFANAPVAAVHALAYPVGARFHVPHGLSNSLVLPAVLRFNLPAARDLYAELAQIIVPRAKGTSDVLAEAMIERLSNLPAKLGLPTRLEQVGIGEQDLETLAGEAMEQTRLLVNNPRDMTREHAYAIYREVL